MSSAVGLSALLLLVAFCLSRAVFVSSAVTCHYMHVWRAWENNARMKSALHPFPPSLPLSLRPPLLHCGCAVAVALGELVRLGARLCAFFFLFIFLFYRSIIISDDIIFIII